jgi:hypothetical protein
VHRLPLLLVVGLLACPSEPAPDPDPTPATVPCVDQTSTRRPLFGDLHVHTRWSFDAYVQDVRVSPDEAYAFARGESVRLPPLDAEGNGTREVRLARPLDFVAITDHAEYLAEMTVCLDPAAPGYDAPPCVAIRSGSVSATYGWGGNLTETPPTRFDSICEGSDCVGLVRDAWRRTVEQAEAWNDATEACEFTALVAYEYSCSPEVSNAHRNVIFRNATVPDLPTTCFEESTDWGLWRALERDCLNGQFDSGVCDVLAIPHNSNWSNGNMFFPDYPFAGSPEELADLARFRSEMEPLVEIYQHKGDSECSMGFASPLGEPDELCGFEKLRPSGFPDCSDGTGSGAMAGLGCKSRMDFVRDALAEGLLEEERIGVNPYRLGIIASTDTHNGIPGYAEEQAFEGHTGREESTAEARLSSGGLIPGGVLMSGGGLAGVWATENSREAIFTAMRRRETFGTSGPRIVPRFYGGALDPGLCEAADMLEQADADGVPMGGDLTGTTASFLVAALADPGLDGQPGTPLQQIQIIKGWVDAAGEAHTRVYEVAGDPDNGAGVDDATCAPTGPADGGDSDLCAVWTDPEFDPSQRAFWYARVLENPTCRWSAWQCNALPAAERPASCTDPAIPRTIQERAWTSPIWFSPEE